MIRLCLMAMILTVPMFACGRQDVSMIDRSNLEEAWNANNDPLRLRDQYQVSWSALPTSGETSRKPWSDTYWPSYEGGIAQRWNDPAAPSAFEYPLIGETKLQAMSMEQRAHLSPAEKFDALLGRFDYPLVAFERDRTNPDDPAWYGLCHGWAPAAINFDEPKPVTLTGASGIEIPFGSSDVKALLIFAQQYARDSRSLGERCNVNLLEHPDRANDPACRDTNAGSFHIVLTNEIALLDRGFVAEVNRGYEVWNQPVHGFKSDVVGESDVVYATAAAGTVKIVTVRTVMNYIAEIGPSWDPMPFADFPAQRSRQNLEYTLELNDAGEIIGGEWLTEERPDFLWTQQRPELTGYFAELQRLYDAAIQ